ncbi:MAG: IS1634 family transposase [Candidatus Scalindua rubra]|nr:IS1634 family transposase [Candidatus Scalindua rubra]
MFIQRTQRKTKDKVYNSVVLMENYREGKKVKHRTITTLTKWPKHLVDDLEKLLKGKAIISIDDLEPSNGKAFGAIEVIRQIAERLGIQQALGNSKQAKLAMVQIAGRIVVQQSRNYIANQWVLNQDIENVFKVSNFNEDSLYANLDWLSENQEQIEKKIFDHRYKTEKVKEIFLYDVTSSYFEGTKNELSDYGYNRDKKKGKMQIVVGLMLDSYGYPLTIEVFEGNTSDNQTVTSQLKKLKEMFGVERVIFVGDKGMIKSSQIDEIISDYYKWDYLTSITKEQIKTLINKGVLQLSLFEDEIIEVEGENKERYILRKNKYRAQELALNRKERIKKALVFIENKTKYLEEHPKAKTGVAMSKIDEKLSQLKLKNIITTTLDERTFKASVDEEQVKEQAELDGCYVVKTSVPKELVSTQIAHDRYKDLGLVEYAFRTMKTTLEEIRPIYVRKEERTRGHVFVVMLAYMITKYISDKISHLNYTRKFAIESLDKIQYIEYNFKEKKMKIPPKKFPTHANEILNALDITLNVAKK